MKRIVADKFIMLGDFHIQNPYVKNEQNLNFEFDENNKLKMNCSMSIFQRLFNQDRLIVSYLLHQYRMNKQISSFINKSIYSDSLFDWKTEDECLPMNSKFIYPSIVYPFLRYVCYSKPWVALINTSHLSKIMQDLSSSCINTTIVNLVVDVLQTVEIINPDEITVINNAKDVEHEEILKSKGITNWKVIDNLYDAENNIVIWNIVVNSKQDSSINNLLRMCAAFGKAIKKRIIIFNNKDILFENSNTRRN